LVFVNAADTKSAQMFTLAHELVHVWSGETGLGGENPRDTPDSTLERWCDMVAAEILVPGEAMQLAFNRRAAIAAELRRLARQFKVSTLVILRRARDIGAITEAAFHAAYDAELERLLTLQDQGAGGGNFHLTEAVRVSPTFARALVTSTLEGHTLYRDAFRMLGIRKAQTFLDFGQSVGVAV
jgi:Zn-dependent peptidase ImmA (M78 family)